MKKLTPLKAIKQKCKEDCCAGDFKSWKFCEIKTCALWRYRFGTNPSRKGIGGNPQLNTHRAKKHPYNTPPDTSS